MLLNSARFGGAASAWSPLDLANLTGWYDPSDLTSVTSASNKISVVDNLAEAGPEGDLVAYNLMGSALQGARAEHFQADKTINGLPCLGRRDDAWAYTGMGNRANDMGWLGNKVGTGDFLFSMVLQYVTAYTGLTYLLHNTHPQYGGCSTILYNFPNAGDLRFGCYGALFADPAELVLAAGTHPLADGAPHWIGLWRDGSVVHCLIDGVTVGTLSPLTTDDLHSPGPSPHQGMGRMMICTMVNLPDSIRSAGANGNFHLGEILMVKGAVSSGEVASLDAYLAAKWGT